MCQRVALLRGRDLLQQYLRPFAVHSVEDEFLGWAGGGSKAGVRGGGRRFLPPRFGARTGAVQLSWGCSTASILAHSPGKARGTVAARPVPLSLVPKGGDREGPSQRERGFLQVRGAPQGKAWAGRLPSILGTECSP